MSESESFNLWHHKPWWCQPWSILLTGILIVVGTWLLTKTLWIAIAVSLVILVWWFYFLILLPQMLKNSEILLPQSEHRR